MRNKVLVLLLSFAGMALYCSEFVIPRKRAPKKSQNTLAQKVEGVMRRTARVIQRLARVQEDAIVSITQTNKAQLQTKLQRLQRLVDECEQALASYVGSIS